MSYYDDYDNVERKIDIKDILQSKKVRTTLYLILLMTIFYNTAPWYVIMPGYSAIHLRLGRVRKVHYNPGFHVMVPVVDTIVPIDMRIQKSVIKTEAFSHDLQIIDVEVAINYRVENPLEVYQNIGETYERIVIDPFTQESLKAVIAMFTAEELTQQREKAKEIVKNALSDALKSVNIVLVDFNFIHVDFHQEFIKAVERKQIAQQKAKEATFDTIRIKEIAIQTKEKADAEAYALKVKKEMATPQLSILKAIEKWDGKLPKIMTTSLATFLNQKDIYDV